MSGWTQTHYGVSRDGVLLRVHLPRAPVRTLLVAALHGEEPETLYLAERLRERLDPAQAGCAIVPCANPDGVLRAQRQNAAGVDLNRNFPASTWSPADSFTFPPACTDRRRPNRTNRSLPGPEPASEPETQALLGLIDRLEPSLIVDLHTPLELLLPTPDVDDALLDRVASAASLVVEHDLGSPTPGALRDWCRDRCLAALTYEVEHGPLPALCARHLPALELLATATP